MTKEDTKLPEEAKEAQASVGVSNSNTKADAKVDSKEAKPAESSEAAVEGATLPVSAPKKKKAKRPVPHGQLHILATFNNTIVTFTDLKGGALAASSAGACGFRGSKKGTAYAAQVAAEKAAQLAKQGYGLVKVDVFVRGIGLGRDAAIRTMQTVGIQVDSITDQTGVPHGGVRPKKARRV